MEALIHHNSSTTNSSRMVSGMRGWQSLVWFTECLTSSRAPFRGIHHLTALVIPLEVRCALGLLIAHALETELDRARGLVALALALHSLLGSHLPALHLLLMSSVGIRMHGSDSCSIRPESIRVESAKMAGDDASKKRPRDILASLDAAFAATSAKPASKYTAQAAQQTTAAATLQAYQHGKHKKKRQQLQQQNQAQKKTNGTARIAGGNKQQPAGQKQPSHASSTSTKEPLDPLYGRLNMDVLQVGLKNCSLNDRIASLRKGGGHQACLKQYVAGLTKDGNATAATDKLKSKVLQFDNPVRTTDAKKRAGNEAQAQTAKLLGARHRRRMGLHLVSASISYEEAQQLCEIWKRYARDIIGNDFTGDATDESARGARLVSKLRTIDLSGCPIEVIRSKNPSNVGTSGVIVADKTRVIQVCTASRGKVITLPKEELHLRVRLDSQRSFYLSGSMLLTRRNPVDC